MIDKKSKTGSIIIFFSIFFLLILHSAAFAKELKVAMASTLTPMHYKNAEGELIGFEVDLVKMYAKERGHTVIFIDPASKESTSLGMVIDGKADMAVSSITITDNRKKWVRFSAPYFSGGGGFLVRDTESRSEFDMGLRTILVPVNSPYINFLRSGGGFRIKYREVKNVDEAVKRIKNELTPEFMPYALYYDIFALREIAKTEPRLEVIAKSVHMEEYGAAFKRNADTSEWDEFIKRISQDGRLNTLTEKWVKPYDLPQLVLSPEDYVRKGMYAWKNDFNAKTVSANFYVKYLPLLAIDYRTSQIPDSLRREMYPYLKSGFSRKWVPHIKELIHKTGERTFMLFYDFVMDLDIKEFIPYLIESRLFLTEEGLETMAVMHRRHPDLRPTIINAYDNYTKNREITVSPYADVLGDPADKVIIKYRTSSGKHIKKNMGGIRFKVIESPPKGPSVIQVNGIEATLEEITVGGENFSVSILSVKNGHVKGIRHPPNFTFGGMNEDGSIMYFDHNGIRFFMDVNKDKIVRAKTLNPFVDGNYAEKALAKIAGLTWSKPVKSYQADKYYVSGDRNQCSLYELDIEKERLVKKLSFLASQSCSHYEYIVDDKLIGSEIGYDSCEPYNMIDLNTGLKVDRGRCAGVVPVGPHEIFYCGENAIIDTRNLERRKVSVNLPCPGKTGRLEPHPKPGYFIYLSWIMC
jgi:ABC-type amino acid transport substrate-binding protein